MSDDTTNTRGPTLLGIEIAFTSLALLTTVGRFAIRKLNRQVGWDDISIVAAMICRLSSFAFTMVTIANGNGQHIDQLSPDQTTNIIKFTWLNEFYIFLTVCLIKISICLYVLRIKRTTWLKRCLYAMMVGLVVTNGSCMIVLLAQCQPLYAYWDRKAGTCWSPNIFNVFIYVTVGYSVLTDLICSFLPAIILWKVKISRQIKFAVSGLMFLGLIATACGVVRASLSVNNNSTDLTYSLVPIDYWAFCEADIGIAAANLALSRAVYVYFKRGRSTNGTAAATGGYSFQALNDSKRGGASMRSPPAPNTTLITGGFGQNRRRSDEYPLTAIRVRSDIKVDRQHAGLNSSVHAL